MEQDKRLVKPIGGSHDFYTYSIHSQTLSEHSLRLSHSLTEDYGICYLTPSSIIISGGYNSSTGSLVDYTYLISLTTMNVEELAPIPIKLKGLRLISYNNNEVYAIGGCTEHESDFTLEGFCFKYNYNGNVWIRLAEMPNPCVFPGVFLQDSNI